MTTYPVSLVLYDFQIYQNLPFSTLTHTEVVVHGKSFGYDDEDGITVLNRENLDQLYNYKIRQVIPLGLTSVSENELREIMREMHREWTRAGYGLFNHNCRHFAKELIEKLAPSDPEVGLETLEQLINFGHSVGTVLITFVRALLLRWCTNPYHYMGMLFYGLNCLVNGEIFNYPPIYKDWIIIIITMVLAFYLMKKRFARDQIQDVESIDLADQLNALQL